MSTVFNDETLMPFGKYKGDKLANVPADYLIYMYDNGRIYGALADYVRNNLDVLRSECERIKDRRMDGYSKPFRKFDLP